MQDKSVHPTIKGDAFKKLQWKQKCLMHAVALNEKHWFPLFQKKQKNPHILLYSTLKCIILGLFITAQNS